MPVVSRTLASSTVLLAAFLMAPSYAGDQIPVFSLWGDSDLPALVDSNDNNAVELGLRFRATSDGHVVGLRYYKSQANTGTHAGSLWSGNGTLLARVTFQDETVSGWQRADFETPVAISANTPYVVSYHAPRGRYSATLDYFASARASGPLIALRDGDGGGNGRYRYGTSPGFPGDSYRSANYWVDVIFRPAEPGDSTPPTAPEHLQASANGDTRLTLFWNASTDNVGVAGYQLFRDEAQLAATSATYHHDTAAVIGETYVYKVRAVDAAGNLSAFSDSLTVTFDPHTPPPLGPVEPGSVGFRGDESTLHVIDRNGGAPAGCYWYGLESSLHCWGDVTLDRVLIRGGLDHYGRGNLTLTNSVIEGGPNFRGVWLRADDNPDCVATITDTTFRWRPGAEPGPDGNNGAIVDMNGCRVNALRNDISGWSVGLQVGAGGTIEANHIHDLYDASIDPETGQPRPCRYNGREFNHIDGIQFFGGRDYLIARNYIDVGWRLNPSGCQTAAIFMGDGMVHRPVFAENFFSGGGYTFRSNTANSVEVIDNIFERLPGQYGDYDITPGTVTRWSGNVLLDGTPLNYVP